MLLIGYAAVGHGADGRALGLVKMAHAFSAAIGRNDVHVLPIILRDIQPFALGFRLRLKDGFIRALRQTCPTINTFTRN